MMTFSFGLLSCSPDRRGPQSGASLVRLPVRSLKKLRVNQTFSAGI